MSDRLAPLQLATAVEMASFSVFGITVMTPGASVPVLVANGEVVSTVSLSPN